MLCSFQVVHKNMHPSCLGNYHITNDNNMYHSNTPLENYYHPSPIYIPLEDEAVFSDFFQQNFFSNDTTNLAHDMDTNMASNMGECSNNIAPVDVSTYLEPESSTPRKRPSKRDRHSKINTARGPRDRRMRLSLDVAKKLFGLQDLLGFDKASKTVDWLIMKSKTAILELLPDRSCSFMGVSNSASCSSECEVLSGTGTGTGAGASDRPMVIIETGDDQEATKNKAKSCFDTKKPKEKVTRGVRRSCADFHHPLKKATRERARERARERTSEKRNNKHKSIGQLELAMDQNVTQLRSWSPFDENRLERFGQAGQMSSNLHIKQGFVNDNSSLFMMGNWNPSSMFDYLHPSGLTHEYQFNEYQITGKAWEGNSN